MNGSIQNHPSQTRPADTETPTSENLSATASARTIARKLTTGMMNGPEFLLIRCCRSNDCRTVSTGPQYFTPQRRLKAVVN